MVLLFELSDFSVIGYVCSPVGDVQQRYVGLWRMDLYIVIFFVQRTCLMQHYLSLPFSNFNCQT
jgi:hypothetical protein